jgi:beta-glucosidase
LSAAQNAGIDIWVCLHHFTLPQWFEDMGGFCNRQARADYWIPHIEFICKTFAHLVHGWMPINEPMAYATGGFLFGMLPPGRQGLESFSEAVVGVFEAWCDAWRVLRSTGPIATIHNLSPVIPIGDDDAAAAAELVDSALWGIPTRAYTDGVVAIPGRDPIPISGLEGSADLFGFSYYNAMGITGVGGVLGALGSMATYPPGSAPGPLGYHPWPDGIEIVVDRLSCDLPGVALLVAENGIGTVDDAERSRFLKRSLELLANKIAAGAEVKGYFHWTSVDNYEWLAGFDVPFGVIGRDRKLKPSAEILKAVAKNG